MLKELAEVLTKPFSIIYQKFWLIREASVDWRLMNLVSIYKEDRREDRGNPRPL